MLYSNQNEKKKEIQTFTCGISFSTIFPFLMAAAAAACLLLFALVLLVYTHLFIAFLQTHTVQHASTDFRKQSGKSDEKIDRRLSLVINVK